MFPLVVYKFNEAPSQPQIAMSPKGRKLLVLQLEGPLRRWPEAQEVQDFRLAIKLQVGHTGNKNTTVPGFKPQEPHVSLGFC